MRSPDDHVEPVVNAPSVVQDTPVADPVDPAPVELTPEQQAEADEAAKAEALANETPEQKEAREAKEAEDAAAAEKAKAEFEPNGAPDGDYEITMPEGFELDQPMLELFVPVAKELNLSNAGAQKLTEFYVEHVQPKIAEQFVKGIEADVETNKATLATELKAAVAEDAKAEKPEDRVFGGKTLEAATQVTARALDRFGSPELREFLDKSGLGNDKEMFKLLYKIGNAIGEDSDVIFGGNIPKPLSREDKYYGKK